MSSFKKHVGRIRNTDRRCVVVYMQIPGNDENALIIDTDALPDRFHDALMDVIDSKEGQEVQHLHTLLSRRVMPDMGIDMMNALHAHGLLRAVDIDNVVMFPAPNAPCPLRTIVDYMNGNPEEKVEMGLLENRFLENQKSDASQGQIDMANNMLAQAQDLENSANAKREQAYRLVPHLRPQVTDSPEVTDAPASVSSGPSEAQTAEHAEEAASTEGMTRVDAGDDAQFHISNEVDVSQLPDDVKLALHAAAAQAAVQARPEPYNIVESAVEAPEAPEYNIVESDAPEAPLVPAYDFVGNEVKDLGDHDDAGNQVDTSDEAVQAFLDRVAHRADLADKELQESLKPKAPVGRPRNDGQPAGTKVEAPAPEPKKRGRPPKAKL